MRIYTFGNGTAEGLGTMVSELGGKGAGLADMCHVGVPVPPGFTISTAACRAFYDDSETFPDVLATEIERGIRHIEDVAERKLGGPGEPLLVSVRSGAAISMPGMMDTILNVGLNSSVMEALAAFDGGADFALDSYRRFIEMFAEIALGLDPTVLATVREDVMSLARVRTIQALDETWHRGLVDAYLKALSDHTLYIPDDPRLQIRLATIGVFRSWNTRRAKRFREANGIPNDLGTAVTVQAMVFGNLGPRSATGVAFTRNPNSGENGLFGEFLPQAQGEDVVSGRFTPRPITGTDDSLEATLPEAYAELVSIGERLESHYRDVQDLEFTIEHGKLWMLQTRVAARSARAALRYAVEFVEEGLLDRMSALRLIDPMMLVKILHASVDVEAQKRVIARGLPASPGAVSGRAIFCPDEAIRLSQSGERVILVRLETSTEDLEAMRCSAGILTSRGGMTSHAALVARGMGRPCVTGCSGIVVDERKGRFRIRNGSQLVQTGDPITIDGATGEVILGSVATSPADPPPSFGIVMDWADAYSTLDIRANADDASAVRKALRNGATGIGLCCTEHMFLDEDHLGLVREMVLAYDASTRRRVIEHILPVQREDFLSLLKVVEGPIAIRLLDLPLHDLMPDVRADLGSVAERLETTVDQLANRARLLRPSNPVLGHRGCRLGLTFPELYEVQIRALFEAMASLKTTTAVEVVIPLVTSAEEVKRLSRRIRHMAERVCAERGIDLPPFKIGAMIESPIACLMADRIAPHADFLLLGTTDLTVTTYGMHRDDSGRYLPQYVEQGVLPADPFVRLDSDGIGELMKIAVEKARRACPDITIGLAGGHANHPSTAQWCCDHGINYLTCAPHRLPIMRLAAAQASGKNANPDE